MSKAKKIARKKRKENRKRKLEFASKLNSFRPKSEIWFEEELIKNDVNFPFLRNEVFAGYIPDFISKTYKIIVEVDGSIHEKEYIKKRDRKKDNKYNSLGYRVVRVKAYDNDSLNNCIKILKELRLTKSCLD